jgi:hypothetical protein
MVLAAASEAEETDMSDNILHNTDPGQRGVEHLRTVKRGGADIFSGWLGYSYALAELRAQHPDDNNAFGAAVKAAKLDVWPTDEGSDTMSEPINDKVRSASLWAASITLDELKAHMTQHPSVEITARGGFRGLHAAVMRAAKPTAEPAQQEEPQAQDEAQPDEAASSKTYTEADVEAAVAAAFERGRLAGLEAAKADALVDPSTLSMSAQQKLEAAKRKMERQVVDELTKEFDRLVAEEVRRVVDACLPTYRIDMERASNITKAYRGVMTKSEYNTVLFCLHPDQRKNVSDEKLDDAFRIMREREIAFLPGGTAAPSAPPLPRTPEEMLARRKAVEAERKAARAAKAAERAAAMAAA